MPTATKEYMMASSIVKGKRVGERIGCHTCGATDVTLYKDGVARICKACRKRKLQETGGDV